MPQGRAVTDAQTQSVRWLTAAALAAQGSQVAPVRQVPLRQD